MKKKKSRKVAGKKARDRGNQNEREWCKILDEVFPEWSPWIRNNNRDSKQTQHLGDLVPEENDNCPLFVECKRRDKASLNQIEKWWHEASPKAGSRALLLCVFIPHRPRMIFSRHWEVAERCLQQGVLPIVSW